MNLWNKLNNFLQKKCLCFIKTLFLQLYPNYPDCQYFYWFLAQIHQTCISNAMSTTSRYIHWKLTIQKIWKITAWISGGNRTNFVSACKRWSIEPLHRGRPLFLFINILLGRQTTYLAMQNSKNFLRLITTP